MGMCIQLIKMENLVFEISSLTVMCTTRGERIGNCGEVGAAVEFLGKPSFPLAYQLLFKCTSKPNVIKIYHMVQELGAVLITNFVL